MAKRTIVQGSTNVTIDIFIQDSSSTTGAGLTGLVFDSAGLTCFFREGATVAAVELTLVTLALITTAHADGGFKEIDATNMPGMYRLDLSDTIVSGTNPYVTLILKGATNMAALPIELELTLFDPFDGVRAGLTALPNAAADAAGGLPISDAGGLDLDARLDAAVSSRLASADINLTAGAVDNVTTVATTTTNTDMRGTDSALLAASINLTGGAVDNVTLVATTTTNTDMRGTDSALLAASAPTNFGDLSITVSTGLVDITQTAADKSWSTATRVLTAGTNLNDLSAAQVNTEVLDVLTVDTFAELGSVPAATSTILDKLNWLFATGRNKVTQTSTTQLVRNDADSGTIGTATVSDDSTTYIRGEFS